MNRHALLFTCLLLLTGSTVFAQSKDAPDLILINGKVWKGTDATSFAEAVAIRGHTISQVGTSSDIRKLADAHTTIIDLQGRLVSAGFNDAHIHFLGGSLGLSAVELTGAQTISAIISRIDEFSQKNPNRKWITGRGWQYTTFPGGLPTKQILADVAKDHPIFIRAYDGHSALVNDEALKLAGINRDTKFDGYGEIVHDTNGEPTGVLKEGAMSLVSEIIPEPTREEKLNALRQGMKLASSLGITSIQNASGSADEFSLYEELFKKGELTMRVAMGFSVGTYTKQSDIDYFVQIKNRIGQNPMLRASSVKFMLDGVIESHTGAMLERYNDVPYDDPLPKGELGLPLNLYRDLVAKFDKLGFQVYTHAIGDMAVREALNAYENAAKLNGTKNSRHRIEHIETISLLDMPRFAMLGVMASMEPIHAEPGTVDVWANAIGAKRLPNSFAWAALLKNNASLVFSSDWPACVSLNPIRGLHTAVTRRTIEGQPPNGWVPEQKIPMAQAMLAYTKAGAYSSFEEKMKGQIIPGQLADIVVFSQDIFQIDPMKTFETKVVMTIFDGKVIYRKL